MNETSSPLAIDICICTFRRDHIAKTLQSLSRLTLEPGWVVKIFVADNDDVPSARELVEKTAHDLTLPITYLHAPARNISVARNACLDVAKGKLLAFVDDDEVAEPGWLSALIKQYRASGADVVLGPVKPLYKPEHPQWMKQGEFHATNPVWVKNEIITGYTCNVLLKRLAPSIKDLRFRIDLGRTGGEDTYFFTKVHKAGGKLSYAPDAIVLEDVPESRAKFLWLLKRVFRSGQTHGTLILDAQGTGAMTRLKGIALASLKALYCYLGAALHIVNPRKFMQWILRGTLHLGVIMRLLGKRELEQYG
jgi:succinoglycan biosynthesis protein ExoM